MIKEKMRSLTSQFGHRRCIRVFVAVCPVTAMMLLVTSGAFSAPFSRDFVFDDVPIQS